MKFISEITVKLNDKMGGDKSIAAAAKVLDKEAYEEYLLTDKKHDLFGILNYMMKHRHGTPFEHSALQFVVHGPIFVWREWHRHRTFSFNEESARYKVLDPVFYLPSPERPMFKVENWKAGRPKFLPIRDQADRTAYDRLCTNLIESYTFSYQKYQENLELNVDPGLARDCLPVGIYSSCMVTCNPRALMHFLSLRTHEPDGAATFVSYPLYEIEVAARIVEKALADGWPLTYKAFCDNGRVAP